jgi:hypothetical protein
VTDVDENIAESSATGDANAGGLPNRPRTITPQVRRRAWGDIHVRFWWLSALAIALIVGYVSFLQIRAAMRDRDVILNGTRVDALIRKAGERDIPGHSVMRDVAQSVILVANLPDGTTRELTGTVEPGTGFLVVGRTLPIRVDKNDPSVWTDRHEVRPWSRELTVPLMFLPVIAALLVVALLVRRKILRIWQSGRPIAGTVVDLRHSAWAPRSRVVRYTIAHPTDRRIFSTLVPKREVPARGEAIQLLHPADGSAKPTILARLYQHG